jgi:hypothetical protein
MEPQQNEPLPKPDQEQSIFNESDYSMDGYDKHIKNARILLFAIAILQFASFYFLPPIPDEVWWFIFGLIVFKALVYAGLAIWTRKKPFLALVIALCFYVGWMLLESLYAGSLAPLFQGWIVKIVVIVLLIVGIRNAKDALDLKKTFNR